MNVRLRAIIVIIITNLIIIVFNVLVGITHAMSNIGIFLMGLVSLAFGVIASIIASTFINKPFEQVTELKDLAEKSSMEKSIFLANMSHEIRTPMTAILGITEILLRDENHSPSLKESLTNIYNSSELLLKIINDILDLSKIESGKLELTPCKYESASFIKDILTLNMMRIGSKQISFELSIGENLPSFMVGDELRIKQILNNLISNAFKYTDKGEVKLSIKVEPKNWNLELEKNQEVMIIFMVSDTGQGMTEEQVSKLFNRYERFNVESNRSIEGTGLGLSITKNLITMMNGTISVNSELYLGTTFTVRIPQECVDSDIIGMETAKNLEKLQIDVVKHKKMINVVYEKMPYGKVLVVDDVELNLYVAKGLMEPYGLTIDTVMSGFEAVDKIKSGCVYDIIFMDHMMPKMDGVETMKIIRSLGYTNPIAALTADAFTGQAEALLSNGFDDYISKPIDIQQLNITLKKFILDKHMEEMLKNI